ncbi:MAG: hypothetical protein NT016_04080 [Candidatus Aenigmarchaeota archaeon]|nr:hypothetical protein [Candidatus Aenigmarchaeota archaeon]
MVRAKSSERAAVLAVALVSILLLASSQAAKADGVAVTIVPSDVYIVNNGTKSVDVTVTNDQTFTDDFSVSVWPSTTYYNITPTLGQSKIIGLAPASSATLKLYFFAAENATVLSTNFTVTATSTLMSGGANSSAVVTVHIQRNILVGISDIFLDDYTLDPAQCMNVRIDVTNLGLTLGQYRLSTVISDNKDSSVVKRLNDDSLNVGSKSLGSVSHQYCLEKYQANGTYTLSATLKDSLNTLIDTRSVYFEVNPLTSLLYDKSVSYTPFAQTKVITIKNDGNFAQRYFNVTESVSGIVTKLFYPVTPPSSIENADGKVTYVWTITRLNPGETTSVTYEIRFVSIWISGLVIALLVYVAFAYVFTPRISKNVIMVGPLKRGKEVTALIEMRNATLYELKNITVTDSIPPIASLVEKFDTMRPDTKRNEYGTQLTWKIKSLKPLEERVLTYRLKTNVDVIGSVRLPAAGMEYMNHKRQTKRIVSKPLELE